MVVDAVKDSLDFAKANNIAAIPIWHRRKEPSISTWKEFQQRMPTDKEYQKWFYSDSPRNIAFVCGSISGPEGFSLVGLDYDHMGVYNAVRPGGSPTRAVRSSRGVHEYYFVPGQMKPERIEIKLSDGSIVGLDIKAEGSYVIAPGSVHPSGSVYEWLNDKPILKLDGETPEHFRQTLLTKLDVLGQERGWTLVNTYEHDVEQYQNGVQEGSRNHVGYVLAAYYRTAGVNQEDSLTKLLAWNTKNRPPLSESEIQSVVASAYKPDAKIGFKFKKLTHSSKSYEKYIEDDKIKTNLIAKDIMNEYHFISPRDTEELLFYKDGIYQRGGEPIVKEWCVANIGEIITRHRIKEVIAFIQGSTYVDRTEINSNINLLHLKNGIFNIETREMQPFSPDIYSTIQVPVFHDPESKCPAIDKFLSEVLYEDQIPLIHELIGYCFYRKYQIQKAFLFVGEGANGKSTLLALLKEMLGADNIATIELQRLETNRFASSALYGKLANMYPDLTDKALYQTGTFKTLTGGDMIPGERKFQDLFRFVNHAKLIFSTNKVPLTHDETIAFFRRWIFVSFPNTFVGQNADKNLLDKLTSKGELSGLFNHAMEGLKRLLETSEFSYSETEEETRLKYIRLSDTLHAFVVDCIMVEINGWISKEDLFNAYCEYCRKRGLPATTKNVVGRELARHVQVTEERKNTHSGRKHGWRGIRFKRAEDEEDGQGVQDVHDFSLLKFCEDEEGEKRE